MMQTNPIQIGSLPVGIICTDIAHIAFVKLTNTFAGIFVAPQTTEESAFFDNAGFSIGEVNYSYGTLLQYKEIPKMLEWLQKQNIINPF